MTKTRADFQCEELPMIETLAQVEATLRERFEIKDISAIITARKDMRTEIFGLLRGVKDVKLTADFSSDEGHLCQQARFDWLLASTTYIEQQRQL